MPRHRKYKLLPPHELAICHRVREARLREGVSQRLLAEEINRTRDQLANIEGGRVPLRFGIAWDLCQRLDLNPLWLLGDLNRGVWVDYNFPTASEDALFSDVLLGCTQDYRIARENFFRAAESDSVLANEAVALPATSMPVKALSQPDRKRFQRHLDRAAIGFLKHLSVQKHLTTSARGARFGAMRKSESSLWKQLRGRLAAATSRPGEKSRLAKTLGVTRQAVSEWTRGMNAPSAETTLRLLQWVTAEEAQSKQKKRAGSAETRPALKTRKNKSTTNEKAKSDRKKK